MKREPHALRPPGRAAHPFHRRAHAAGGRHRKGHRPRPLHRRPAGWATALVGLIGRSPVAHGVIRSIDASRALALPGVRAVITGEDFSAPYGVIPIAQNEWPLARGKVRYRGEPLFAVAADDEVDGARGAGRGRGRVRRTARLLHVGRRAGARARCCCTTTSRATSSGRSSRTSATSTPASRPPTWCWSAPTNAPRSRTARSSSTPPSRNGSRSAQRLTVHSVTQVPYYLHLMLAQTLGHRRLAGARRQALRRRRLRPSRRAA